MKSKLLFAIPVIVFTILNGIWLGKGLPHGVHVWAQSDRYAIARNFIETPDITDPRTHNLASEAGKVGVEFPGVQFISAILARAINRDLLPFIYRWLTALIFLGGLISFLSSTELPNLLKATLSLLLLSPIGLYYQFNFLPDSASLGFLLFAFAAFNKFRKSLNYQHLIHVLILSGGATLLKTSSGVYFIAFAAIPFVWPNRSKFPVKERSLLFLLSLVILALVAFYDYYFFMEKNRRLWSVVFMSSSNPINSLDELRSVWKNMRTWRLEYLSVFQYGTLLILSLLLLRSTTKSVKWSGTRSWFILSLFGVLAFFLLIGKQFSNHDYYFICTFFPLFIWVLTELVRINHNRGTVHYTALLSPMIFLAFLHGIQISKQAYERGAESYVAGKRLILNETRWMEDARSVIEKKGIPNDALFFVLYEFGPNTPLVLIDRKGLVFNHEEMSRDDETFNYWKDKLRPQYALIRTKWLPNLQKDRPHFLENMRVVFKDEAFILLQFHSEHGS